MRNRNGAAGGFRLGYLAHGLSRYNGYSFGNLNNIRVEVTMPYTPAGPLGFPDEATSELLDRATEAMQAELKGKTTAIMTGIYTGAGERNWVFYTFSTDAFGGFLNRALAELPLLPLQIYAENDPDWAEYDEMLAECAPADGALD